MYSAQDVLEGCALRVDTVVGDEAAVDDGESDVKDAYPGVELDGEWGGRRLALRDGPTVERHAMI